MKTETHTTYVGDDGKKYDDASEALHADVVFFLRSKLEEGTRLTDRNVATIIVANMDMLDAMINGD